MSIKNIKVSIVTVVKNGMPFLEDCIKSFQLQDYKNKELIVVYSHSEDQTYTFLKKQKCITKLIIDNKSKNKFGSLNIGLQNTTGDIIGLLHADDIFGSNKVLSNVAKTYQKRNFDILFGNIKFCLRNNLLVIKRIWTSSKFSFRKLQLGWMPPHVSIFISKEYKKISYRTNYPISGDYDYILRIFRIANNVIYLNYVTTIMRLGGVSNKFIFKKTKEDLLIARNNLGYFFLITIFFKNIIKIDQLLTFSFKNNFNYIRYVKKNFQSRVSLISSIRQINQKKKFLLCARNLAFYSLVVNKINVLRKDLLLWQDGTFPFDRKFKKYPGRDVLNQLQTKKFDKIYLLTKKNKTNYIYLKKRFKKNTVIGVNLPISNIDTIIKNFNKLKIYHNNKTLFIICLPTPKQELLGFHIMNKFENAKVLCIGGALDYLSGIIKKPPHFFSGALEFIWRLRSDFFRRTSRLVLSCIFLVKNYLNREFYDLNTKH
jgi:glycosyltransferase